MGRTPDDRPDTPEARAQAVREAIDWEPYGAYEVRTENRGHGIVAVYVKGPADKIDSIQRTSRAYARKHLTFAPGMSGGAVSGGGGEITDGGATFISQDVYATQPVPPRTD